MNASSISMNDELRAELDALAKKADEAIDLSDIPEATAAQWKNAEHGRFFRPIKKPISLRVDADIIAWFKSLDGKYQSKMNDALREYMEHHAKV